jgi:hypothetical protein
LLYLFFDPEDGGDMLLSNVGGFSADFMASYPKRYNFSELRSIYFLGRDTTNNMK